jgi:hypothetical protein
LRGKKEPAEVDSLLFAVSKAHMPRFFLPSNVYGLTEVNSFIFAGLMQKVDAKV